MYSLTTVALAYNLLLWCSAGYFNMQHIQKSNKTAPSHETMGGGGGGGGGRKTNLIINYFINQQPED